MFNEIVAISLFAVAALLAATTIFSTRRLIRRACARGASIKRARLMWVIHVFSFAFIFIPVVVWPLIAFPVVAAIPAALTFGATLYGYFHVVAEDRASVLVVVVVSSAMWVCYGFYEHQMQLWARTVIAPIRVDLAILAPLIYYSSLFLVRLVRATHVPGITRAALQRKEMNRGK